MPVILHLRFLGTFSITYDVEPVATLRAPRLQSLLANLVLHGDSPQLRQQIAFQFWPETTDDQAQTNLRQLVHALRRRLPHADQFLIVTSDRIGWRGDAPFRLDVADFQLAVVQAQQGSPSEQVAALARAVDLYAGDLLPNCYDDWILPEREQLAQQFLATLEKLSMVYAEQHDYVSAIDYAQRLLRYDPVHEVTYKRLMEMYVATGDRAAALRIYHTCASLLERELGVEPSISMRKLYERLLHGEEIAVPATHIRAQTPFVGRSDEWQSLKQFWSSAKRGRPYVCLYHR
jgi:DNA-binding SARP family transcriptional activator